MKPPIQRFLPMFCSVLSFLLVLVTAPAHSAPAPENGRSGSQSTGQPAAQKPAPKPAEKPAPPPEASAPQPVPDKDRDPDPDTNKDEVKAEMKAAAEEAIKHLLVSQVEAWNRGNLQGFMNGYWHNPDLTFFSGATVTHGWLPTLQRYQQRYQSGGREMGQLEFQDLKIDLLSRRAAVVTGAWQLTMSDGKKPHGLFTLIFKQMKTGWRIVHDHSSGE